MDFKDTLKTKATAEILLYISSFNKKIDFYTNILNNPELLKEKGMVASNVKLQICLAEEKKMMCVNEINSRQDEMTR